MGHRQGNQALHERDYVFLQPALDDNQRRGFADKNILFTVDTVVVVVCDEEVHRVHQVHAKNHCCCACPFPFSADVFFLQDEGECQVLKEYRKCCHVSPLIVAPAALMNARGLIKENKRPGAFWLDKGGVGNLKISLSPFLTTYENVTKGFAVVRVDLRSTHMSLSQPTERRDHECAEAIRGETERGEQPDCQLVLERFTLVVGFQNHEWGRT